MHVKDIRQFRNFYKSSVKNTEDQNRNPHFAGRSRKLAGGEEEYGFFEMYHGQKQKMENLLKTILEMARDSQALYEFMQNAVDAESSDFIMFSQQAEDTGQWYLVVLNNGKPFDLKGVLSILDIGASTKFGDADTIGQFGVGFKLAHRLVGEDAGLEELMEQNKGPILFSWANSELQALANEQDIIEPKQQQFEGKGDEAECASNEPWLFKILYTNFPCLLGESVVDARGRETSAAFDDAEVTLLRRVARECLSRLTNSSHASGTLLLIPLHHTKISEVTENSTADGLPITAAILSHRKGHQKLQNILLNDINLQAANMQFMPLRHEVASLADIADDEQRKLLSGIKTIELDFCYNDPFAGENLFRNRPQFYLYFPMTEERHGFRFAVHSNAFSFTSARTALQDNSQRNKLLFRMLAEGLDGQLKVLAEDLDERFLQIYASLVLSQPGQGTNSWKANREWLQDDFWTPLMSVLVRHIPLRNGSSWKLAQPLEKVWVKDSLLPLEEWMPAEQNWFYWDARQQPELYALALEKLPLASVTIADVLEQQAALPLINAWLEQNARHASLMMEECASAIVDEEKHKHFWSHFKKLKLWHFENGQKLSAEGLTDADSEQILLIQYSAITPIKTFLERAGFWMSSVALDEYSQRERELRQRLSGEAPYLQDYIKLFERLNLRFSDPELFSVEERKEIFGLVYKSVHRGTNIAADRIKILRKLAIFRNKQGEVKRLESLIGLPMEKVPQMLRDWCIRQDDSHELDLKAYLATSYSDIHEHCVADCWLEIAAQTSTPAQREELFKYIQNGYADGMETLPPQDVFFSDDEHVPSGSRMFYRPELRHVDEGRYALLRAAFSEAGLGKLPQRSLLPFYEAAPFQLPVSNGTVKGGQQKTFVLRLAEAKAFVSFALSVQADFLQLYLIAEDALNGNLTFSPNAGAIVHYTSEAQDVTAYISAYHPAQLALLPATLRSVAAAHILQGPDLMRWLMDHLPDSDKEATLQFARILRASDSESKAAFLSKGYKLYVPATIEAESLEHLLLQLLFSTGDASQRQKLMERLIHFRQGEEDIALYTLSGRGSDKLPVGAAGEAPIVFSIASLLEAGSNDINQVLTGAAAEWERLPVGASLTEIEEALGIRKQQDPRAVFHQLRTGNDGLLATSVQLAFALLLADAAPDLSLEGLRVTTLAGDQPLAKGVFYLPANEALEILPQDLILSSNYKDFADHLSHQQAASFRLAGTVLCHGPYIDDAGRLQMPGVKAIVPEAQTKMLHHISSLWQAADSPPQITWPEGDNHWEALVGHDVTGWVLLPEVALSEEEVPFSDFDWEGDESSVAFLTAFGAQGTDSALVQLRLLFLRGGKGSLQSLQDARHVRNTLLWLASKALSVHNSELIALYSIQHHPISEPLPPLPCYRAGVDGMLITNNPTDAFLMSKPDSERLFKHYVPYSKSASACNADVVVPIGCLSQLQPRIDRSLKQLTIKWGETDWDALRKGSSAWEHPAYQSWASAIPGRPTIKLYNGAMPKRNLVFGNSIDDYEEGNAAFFSPERTYFLNVNVREDLLLDELIVRFPQGADWASLKEAYVSETSRFQQLIARARTHADARSAIDKILSDVQATEDRVEKAALVNNREKRYTLEWFMSLLDLVKAQEKKTGIPDITFANCVLSKEGPEVYELSETQGNVPYSIEDMVRINAEVKYTLPNGEVATHPTSLQASYRYRKLKVIFRHVLPLEVNPGTIQSVRLSFDRTVDLMERLRSGFRNLGLVPKANLKDTLSHDIRFLFGPPGTGKTTELAKRVIRRMEDGTDGPIVVLTPTNKAANVLVRKIVELSGGAAPAWLIRTGNCPEADILALGIVVNEGLVINERTQKVVVTTIHRFTLQQVATASGQTDDTLLCNCTWSQVIFDEASMIPLAYITHAIHARQQQRPQTEFLVAGDPLQIPPVFDLASGDLEDVEELQMQNIYTMIGLHSFDKDVQAAIPIYGERGLIENLPEQHRSITPIGELFSRYQYGGRIKHSRGKPHGRRPDDPKPLPAFFRDVLGFRPITVVRYKVQQGETIFNPRKLDNSPMHLYLSLLISELVKRLRHEVDKEASESWSLGILAPYRAQATVMGGMIDAHPAQSERLRIATDTVHGFQGDQNDIIFAVLNPTSASADWSRFLKKPFIINVAISRPEDYLVVFVPDDKTDGLENLPELTKLLSIIRSLPTEHWCEMHAADIEPKIMPDKNYFERYTFTTAHQSVNVYGKPPHPYFIRLCDSAVDVHWEGEADSKFVTG